MASSYTGLGTELMTTGENAGNWGSKTNTNLQILEQISGGYTAQSIAGSAQTTTLSIMGVIFNTSFFLTSFSLGIINYLIFYLTTYLHPC